MKHFSSLVLAFAISVSGLWAQKDTASNASNWAGTPNPGFEDWTHVTGISTYDTPDGWDCANSQSAITGTFGCVKATSPNIKSGSFAVKLITQSILGITAPGVVTTGTLPTSSTGSISGGIAYTLRPDSIVGWYMGTPQSGDNAFATMFLFGSATGNTDTVAVASYNSPTTAVSAYKRFAAAFVYRNSDPIVNSVWLLSSSKANPGVVGSTAYFDDVAVIINSTVGITQLNPELVFTVSPNPASDHIIVAGIVTPNALISLYDMTGRKLTEQKLTSGTSVVDVSGLVNGLYIYSVTDENNQQLKTGKLIIQK